MAKATREEMATYETCVLNRMDEKGETLEEAIEAVIGNGRGELFEALKRSLRGEKA